MQPTVLDRLLAIGSLFQRDMQRAFAGTSLTEPRLHALWVLQHAGPVTQQVLAEAMGTTARSVSALVDGLVSTGYVERRPHPADRRAVLVTPTRRTADMMARMQRDHAELSVRLIDAVDPDDRAAFERGIDAVFRRLDRIVREEAVHYSGAAPEPEPQPQTGAGSPAGRRTGARAEGEGAP